MPSRSVSSFPYKVILLGKKCGRFFYLSVFLTFFFFCSGKSETLIDISHFLRRKPLMEDDSSQIAQKDKWPTFHFYFKRSWDHVLYYSLKNWRESSWEKWLRYFSGTIIRWRQKNSVIFFSTESSSSSALQTKLSEQMFKPISCFCQWCNRVYHVLYCKYCISYQCPPFCEALSDRDFFSMLLLQVSYWPINIQLLITLWTNQKSKLNNSRQGKFSLYSRESLMGNLNLLRLHT